MMDAQLREPLWLLLALIPALLWLLAQLIKHWRQSAYADPHLRDWVVARQPTRQRTRLWQGLFLQLAWISFAIAMAGPRLPLTLQDTNQSDDSQLLVVVDLSLSMSARDVRPSRIERAKLELLDLIERAQRTRIGVIVYAAQSHVLCPPTTDKSVLRHYVQSLRTQLLPTAGSRTQAALIFAAQQFKADSHTSKALLLISDGETNTPTSSQMNDSQLLGQTLKQQHIHLYVLAVGSKSGAALMTPQRGWLEYDHQAVVSRLNSEYLQHLAALGNGVYQDVSDDDSDWQTLYDRGIAQLPLGQLRDEQTEQIQWQEFYSGFVLFGLVCLLIAGWQHVQRLRAPALIMPLACLLLMPLSPESRAEPSYAQAVQFYQQGEFQRAREIFASIPGYAGRFAEGSAAYHQHQYQQAIPLFVQAILDANTAQQRSDAIFNLANSYYQLEDYAMARTLYQDVLRYQPGMHAAQINLQYATALLEQNKTTLPTKAQRAGTGPRTAEAPPDLDVGLGKLSLGESTATPQDEQARPLATSPPQPAEQVLQQSRPASGRVEYDQDLSWTYDIQNLATLQQSPPRIDPDESVLWQRLFEVEENFEAAQEVPNPVPGVKPW